MIVLALNVGSSTVKAGLFEIGPDRAAELARERADRSSETLETTLRGVVSALRRAQDSPSRIDAVGHRVVHGGARFVAPELVGEANEAALAALEELAPLHNGPSLEGLRVARALFGPSVPSVAVFDTAFHATLPPEASHYALPAELAERDEIRRFGFHGLSYESVVAAYPAVAGRPVEGARIVALHLGSGCSAAAIAGGRSVETSMGLTPLEGLVMGTRSGDVDPALVGILVRRHGVDVATVEEWLNRRSGLLGLSGLSSDVRVLLEREAEHAGARLALGVFCHRIRKIVGAYLAVLGGADALVFTGGIGEHSPAVRARVCDGLAALGIVLDAERNAQASRGHARIGADRSPVAVYVIPSDEERMIALAAARAAGARAR